MKPTKSYQTVDRFGDLGRAPVDIDNNIIYIKFFMRFFNTYIAGGLARFPYQQQYGMSDCITLSLEKLVY